jgi:hypothetical protein
MRWRRKPKKSACDDCPIKGCNFRGPYVSSYRPKEKWLKEHPEIPAPKQVLPAGPRPSIEGRPGIEGPIMSADRPSEASPADWVTLEIQKHEGLLKEAMDKAVVDEARKVREAVCGPATGGLVTNPSPLWSIRHPGTITIPKGTDPEVVTRAIKQALERYSPKAPAKPLTLLEAFDAFQKESREIFIERQKEHAQGSINDVGLDDLMGVMRLKVARAKRQVLAGVPVKKVFKDSLVDLANYCFIMWAKYSDEWNLPWQDKDERRAA